MYIYISVYQYICSVCLFISISVYLSDNLNDDARNLVLSNILPAMHSLPALTP